MSAVIIMLAYTVVAIVPITLVIVLLVSMIRQSLKFRKVDKIYNTLHDFFDGKIQVKDHAAVVVSISKFLVKTSSTTLSRLPMKELNKLLKEANDIVAEKA